MTILTHRITEGLLRKSLTKCSVWTERYRVSGKPFPGAWSFKHHTWTREMCDCQDELIIGQKAAQMGYTEVALNRTFFDIDIRGESVLYVLPASKPDASDFSSSRFDPALELSSHLTNLFSEVKNINHKRAGSANLYIRGSRSRSQLKSIPVARIIFDEVDEMNRDNVALARERVSGQKEWSIFELSTPTVPDRGINASFKQSSQDHFDFRCPACNRWTELIFPDCLVIQGDDIHDVAIKGSHLICKECKTKLPHKTKHEWLKDAEWHSRRKSSMSRGFYINQLYSPTVTPYTIAINVIEAETHPGKEQELFNSKMGLPKIVEGARVTDQDLDGCLSGHKMGQTKRSTLTTMGVDVGKVLNIEICEWVMDRDSTDINIASQPRVLLATTRLHFEELDNLMLEYNINFCIIDANPERRKATEFAQRFEGLVKLCFYAVGVQGKQMTVHPDEEYTLSVDRTSWMDVALCRFKGKRIRLPLDIPTTYREQVKEPVRVYKTDRYGNPVARYIEGDKPDHYAHSRTYNEIALQLAASIGGSHDII